MPSVFSPHHESLRYARKRNFIYSHKAFPMPIFTKICSDFHENRLRVSRKSVPIFTKICYDFYENLFQSFTKICSDFHENLTGPQHYVQIHPQQTNADSAKRNSFTPTKHSTNFTAPIFIKPKPLDNFFRVFLYLLFLCPPPHITRKKCRQ
jgi:hypothetical protein